MFATGRTLLRASIEEEAQRYDNIIDILKSYFEANIEKIENETKLLRNGYKDEEVISVISLNETTIDIFREGLEKCCEMLIVRIHSYAESNLHEMLKQYFGWSEYKLKCFVTTEAEDLAVRCLLAQRPTGVSPTACPQPARRSLQLTFIFPYFFICLYA
jgi:hypothetical protein